MERPRVFRSGRIKVTEKMIRSTKATRVLEVGAGDYSFDYLQRPGAVWEKVDFAPPCNIVCDLNRSDVKLPFADGAFDFIICTQVLEHLLWPHKLLAEMARVLCSNGQVLLSIPNCTSLSYRIAWLMGHLPSCAATGNLPVELGSTAYRTDDNSTIGGHVIDFNRNRLERLLTYVGFTVSTVRGSGIIWHKQILPSWAVPPSLASNVICLVNKNKIK